MRDRQTDSWWSIMTGDAIGGSMMGLKLNELPDISSKTTYGEWKKLHPNTKVLSVEGKEHDSSNPYESYFSSDKTFRDVEIQDTRLKAKQPIFSFKKDGVAYAVAFEKFENGGVFELSGVDNKTSPQILLYRSKGISMFASTDAFLVPRGLLEERDGSWYARKSPKDDWNHATRIDSESVRNFGKTRGVQRLDGFDTFWYNWVLVNDKSVVLN